MFDLDKKIQEPEQSQEVSFIDAVMSKQIRSTDSIKQNEYIAKIENTKKFSKGNISGWIGMAKSKKTFALTMFAAAVAGGVNLYGKFVASRPCKVLYVDTEQSPSDVQRVVKRIKALIGSEENVMMFGLRPLTPKDRIKAIELLLERFTDIEVLIIDGVRDLLMDINNAVESTEVMTLLMKWSFEQDIHIATVLHQNKADGNSRGHIGTELNNKAETILRVKRNEVDKDISIIEEVVGRGKGFEDFSFQVNEQGLPEVVEGVSVGVNLEEAPF